MSVLEDLIEKYKKLVPVDARPDNSDEDDALITGWFGDGASIINGRIGTTTQVSTTITLVEGQADYDLPGSWRRLTQVIPVRPGVTQVLGVPVNIDTVGAMGYLPSGQEITPGMDMINRIHRAQADDEVTYGCRLFAGKLRVEFRFSAGDQIRVEGLKSNRNVEDVPEDYWDLLVTYVRLQSIEAQIPILAATAATDGSGMQQRALGQLNAHRNVLLSKWRAGVAGIEGDL